MRGDIAVYPRRASPDAYLSVLLKQMFSLGLSLFMLWALALERRASLLSVLVCGNIVPQRLLSLCRSCTPPYLMVSLRADLHAGHTSAASAFLRKCGVDIIRVKKWFQSNLETYNKISEIVAKAEIMDETIAISVYDKEDTDANITCAKAADELLTISNITASFVIGKLGEKVCISGRSIGDINVQLILEKLGGGGHITVAGAQLEGMTLEEVKQELINRINEYFTEVS